MNSSAAKLLFLLAALFSLSPWASSGTALLLGVILAVSIGNPFADTTKKLTSHFLSLAVIGLGAGMNLNTVAKVGVQGIGYTVITIGMAFLFGTLLGKILKTAEDTSILVTVGTAICGGSAIAAVSPVLRAKPHEVSVSLGIVFMLNALALFTFPAIGHHFQLDEGQFGLWAALAIHDTSSVVGASLQYGPHALEVGTTVKLARALWIVPVTFLMGLYVARRKENANETTHQTTGEKPKPKRPWFILGFILMAALVTWIPALQGPGHVVEMLAKHLLVLTLFLIGTNLTRATLKAVGFKPFLQGIILWITMATSTLLAITEAWIH
jgi:uncharacterized integral membrane protein (TIGR00698 family)